MNKEMSVEELINSVEKKFEKNNHKEYEPFIRTIRFPRFKKLEDNSKITFEYPLTVLVGVNGTNKTSILQALYGAPNDMSIGNYWFSTDIDKINSQISQRFIYSYFHPYAKKEVEVIKTRVKKKDNPDYWESSRPIKREGMEIPSKEELENARNKSTSRWDLINKNVVFCDFKAYISAFDMLFYHYKLSETSKYKTSQDFLRYRSKKLANAISNNLETCNWGNVERIEENKLLSEDANQEISKIMGENYEEIRIISHRFYSIGSIIEPLKTIYIKKKDIEYSEAFAGSGESRLILLVDDILSAPNNSLILIDEPEINLHPRAIKNFQKFLLEQALQNNHQIVVTTHSHYLIDNLPPKAIKLLSVNNEGSISIRENVRPSDAFFELGENLENKIKIFVEDDLAQAIVESRIEKSKQPALQEMISVEPLNGGAEAIIKSNIVASSVIRDEKSFYLLDGDKNLLDTNVHNTIKSEWIEDGTLDVSRIPESENNCLNCIIKELTGIGSLKFNHSGGENKEVELIKAQRNFISYWKNHVFFLPGKMPEEALAKAANCSFEEGENGKDFYKRITIEMVGSDKINSGDILTIEKSHINHLEEDCEFVQKIDCIINSIMDKSN